MRAKQTKDEVKVTVVYAPKAPVKASKAFDTQQLTVGSNLGVDWILKHVARPVLEPRIGHPDMLFLNWTAFDLALVKDDQGLVCLQITEKDQA